jgi:hypothetical protein
VSDEPPAVLIISAGIKLFFFIGCLQHQAMNRGDHPIHAPVQHGCVVCRFFLVHHARGLMSCLFERQLFKKLLQVSATEKLAFWKAGWLKS